MSNAVEPWQQHFSITFADDELQAYQKFMAQRYARRNEALTYWGLVFVAVLAIGLVTLGALDLGLIEATALQPILLAAFAAFFAGVISYWYVVRQHTRAYYRDYARASRTWHYCFDDSGISYKNEVWQVHLLWHGVRSVEDLDWAVIMLTAAGEQAVFIPSRAFSDMPTRQMFVAASAARIKAAREAPAAPLER